MAFLTYKLLLIMNDAYENMDPGTRAAIHDNWADQQEREYEKRKKLLEEFTGGWERYNKEPLFRAIIEALSRPTCDYIDVIERLIAMNLELSERMRKILIQWPSPFGPKL
jgi:hypothetical protein